CSPGSRSSSRRCRCSCSAMACGTCSTPSCRRRREMTARLTVEQLSTSFPTEDGLVRSVADVSFSIQPGKTTALVGESGSGRSVTSLTLMGLLAKPANAQVSGRATFVTRAGRSVDLLQLSEGAMRRLRGNELAMIFQEPMTSLNPVFTVGEQIAEGVRL